ncbi:hypothetical protein CPB83DRAFT_853559 [Crepidotus variabilis]|uniref:Uncharacterized protein n=1 Tax=Crepidotus variabilis TaxID=179855 RepID=A0A9P6EG80_9AGAR|nr:hypothetical protein CPB83DRAFT_853559 [Crepidotus variabilis]
MKFSIFAAITTIVAAVSASPLAGLEARDVFVPPITSPNANTTWISGQTTMITWDTSNHPVNITNKVGLIFLRKGPSMTPLILAEKFDILLGSIPIQVPNVVEANDYAIVLFGDSGNISPPFSITGSGISF